MRGWEDTSTRSDNCYVIASEHNFATCKYSYVELTINEFQLAVPLKITPFARKQLNWLCSGYITINKRFSLRTDIRGDCRLQVSNCTFNVFKVILCSTKWHDPSEARAFGSCKAIYKSEALMLSPVIWAAGLYYILKVRGLLLGNNTGQHHTCAKGLSTRLKWNKNGCNCRDLFASQSV